MDSVPGFAWLVGTCKTLTVGPDAAWYSDLLGLVGLLMLTWPALKLDRVGRRLRRLERPAAPEAGDDDEAFWSEIREKAATELKGLRDTWTPASRLLLWGGFVVSLVGAAMKVARC